MSGLETILAIGGAVFSAIGSMSEGNAQAAAHEQNAQMGVEHAAYVTAVAGENERRDREDKLRLMGTSRANVGASGVALEGSPSDVLADSAASLELDILTNRHRTLMDARSIGQQAQIDRNSASTARTGGYLGAGMTLLGSAAKMGWGGSSTAPPRIGSTSRRILQ